MRHGISVVGSIGENGHTSGLGFFVVIVLEFKRAMAAEQRYDDLEHVGARALARDRIAPADIPRRIFAEFYSSDGLPNRATKTAGS